MTKLKQLWLRIPRKCRVVLNILGILILLFAIYTLIGSPAFTAEQRFRRAEKANLIGPAQIIEIVDTKNGIYNHLVVADDGDAIVFYTFSNFADSWGRIYYREKTGPITVLAAPNFLHAGSSKYEIDLPVFIFHEYPEAFRAELELTLGEGLEITEPQWKQGEQVVIGTFEKSYLLESHSQIEGYFRFNLHAQSEDWYVDEYGMDHGNPLDSEGEALELFSWMMTNYSTYADEYIPATVRLYDAENNLIVEQDLTIRSAAGELYAQREGLE